MSEEKTLQVSHVFADENSNKILVLISEFTKGKKNVEKHWSTSALIKGINGTNAQVSIITSCLVFWDTTESDYKQFQTRLQLTGKPF